MSDNKTKNQINPPVKEKEKEVYGPSPVLSILKDLEELLNDKEEYRF